MKLASYVITLIQIMTVVADMRAIDRKKTWVLHVDMGKKQSLGDGGLVTAIHMAHRFMAANY